MKVVINTTEGTEVIFTEREITKKEKIAGSKQEMEWPETQAVMEIKGSKVIAFNPDELARAVNAMWGPNRLYGKPPEMGI